MKKEHEKILQLGKIDPLHEAELLTGKSYKEDDQTSWLGFALQMEKSKQLEQLLKSIGDTTFSNKLSDYLRIVTAFGFEIIYQNAFVCEGRNEQHFILWHKGLSILLNFDTFSWGSGELNVNSGNFYYNWSPHKGERYGLTSSGHFYSEKDAPHLTLWEKDFSAPYYIPKYPSTYMWGGDLSYEICKKMNAPIEKEQQRLWDSAIEDGKRIVWVGDHDCREMIITKIKAMYEGGIFLKKWKECQFPWLTNYSDHKNGKRHYPFTDLYEKTKSIIKTFPDFVKEAIGEYKP